MYLDIFFLKLQQHCPYKKKKKNRIIQCLLSIFCVVAIRDEKTAEPSTLAIEYEG